MNIDVLDAVAAHFKSRPVLVASFHGGELYLGEAPERATYPYAVQLLIGETPQDTTEPYQAVLAQVQIGVYHASASRARASARLILDAYEKATLTVGGSTYGSCRRTDSAITRLAGYGPGGLDAWIASHDFEIQYHRYVGED
jgi:hypothetical protein